MIPETAALMERIKTEGAFNVLADTFELILRLDNKVGGNDAPDTLARRIAKRYVLHEVLVQAKERAA
jgi:hypothetical protein